MLAPSRPFPRTALELAGDDVQVTSASDPKVIAYAVRTFFAEHGFASLRLPSGWFGRPYDNGHELTETGVQGADVLICLDGTQVLTLDAETVSVAGRVLRITIRGGRWRWTGYGSDVTHDDAVGPGIVEFHG